MSDDLKSPVAKNRWCKTRGEKRKVGKKKKKERRCLEVSAGKEERYGRRRPRRQRLKQKERRCQVLKGQSGKKYRGLIKIAEKKQKKREEKRERL